MPRPPRSRDLQGNSLTKRPRMSVSSERMQLRELLPITIVFVAGTFLVAPATVDACTCQGTVRTPPQERKHISEALNASAYALTAAR
jgi:hypothetical protein